MVDTERLAVLADECLDVVEATTIRWWILKVEWAQRYWAAHWVEATTIRWWILKETHTRRKT